MDDTTPKKLINMEAKQKSPNLFLEEGPPPSHLPASTLLEATAALEGHPETLTQRATRKVGPWRWCNQIAKRTTQNP